MIESHLVPAAGCPRRITRREWTKLAAAAALLAVRSPACAAALSWDAPYAGALGAGRRYRVDAQVVLFSVPLVRRAGVGAGTAAWRESADGEATTRVLEFAAFSFPEHAAGLNRLGFIQERIRIAETGMDEAIYFGLMTASAEESAGEARKALHSTASRAVYTAVDAHIRGHSMETATARFTAPTQLAGHRTELERMAREALAAAPRQSVNLSPESETPPPFLQALAELLRRPVGGEGRYIYNGRYYRLQLRRSADPKTGEHFRARGLASGVVVAVTGTLQRAGDGKPIEFRLWVDESAQRPLPLRIEYQPKPYLRLAFEAEA
jgi:hypothetical protein